MATGQIDLFSFLNTSEPIINTKKFNLSEPTEEVDSEKIKSEINRLRRIILIHSCIYYRMNESVIDDFTFDEWSRELVHLQLKYPGIAGGCVFAEAFKDFDGKTGFDLPLRKLG